MQGRRDPVTFGTLTLDPSRRTVTVDTSPINVTRTEFELLHVLIASGGDVVSRESLISQVWGPQWHDAGHQLEVHLSRLRSKLKATGGNETLLTSVRGVGYRLSTDGEMQRNGGESNAKSATPEFMVTYDHDLTLVAVTPADRPFLGWSARQHIGTYFALTVNRSVYSSRAAGLATVQTLVSGGIKEWSSVMALRCADGSEEFRNVSTTFIFNASGRFNGMISRVFPR